MKDKIRTYFPKLGLLVISVLFILCYLFLGKIIYYFPNFFSDNSSFYFYSSILQANAAIFSIVGVFYIFKIQSLQSSLDIIKTGLMNDQGRNSWPQEIMEWDRLPLDEKESKINDGTANKHILKSLIFWATTERKIYTFKKVIIFPSVLLAFGILLESLSLFSAYYVHSQFEMIEFYISFTNLVVEFFIIIYVIKTILSFFK
jgi:hypothetical protein